MSDEKPIRVTVTDPDTGEVLGQRDLKDDHMVICHGDAYLHHTQQYPGTGTTVLTIKREQPDAF